MSLWKELYAIFDNERSRWQSSSATRQELVFELQGNLRFLADALHNDLDQAAIAQGLDSAVFERSLASNFSFNSICKRSLKASTSGDFDEFKKYLGKDTEYLIKNVYSKILLLKKLSTINAPSDLSRRYKSLFRVLMLVVAHIENQPLKRQKDPTSLQRAKKSK
ncbi:hypothetical protein MIB92_17800 [Aestuariirhabdus sp. Z084]|uniref:hypothetical protein n=1 Tax=Aestuariirhabdus haliotis TaxID=2918751 RepID=UPI00201B3BA3|nr:hypothetical protein [Aestuariirhabdus haliotis]MCL6417520.1 hypothetical protein [Aestuariirhabdus haliotis]MCL6421468.1 hypothetical protein [Aestuariirhabdus haliotis]